MIFVAGGTATHFPQSHTTAPPGILYAVCTVSQQPSPSQASQASFKEL